MFLFKEVLCRWGAVEEVVTDNGMPYVAALDWLVDRYGIRHICISAYNSRANGIVEQQHRTIIESLIKCYDPARDRRAIAQVRDARDIREREADYLPSPRVDGRDERGSRV